MRNLADFLADAKAAGCWCYGADGASPTSYDEPDYRGGVVLVLGAEGSGLRPRVAQACDALVSLPLRGRVAVAERQRRRRRAPVRNRAAPNATA